MAINFIRFTETLKVREEMRVVSVTLRPTIADCTGELYITDLQVQEGGRLTGYTPHTMTMLRNSTNPKRYHNGIVRSAANAGDEFALLASQRRCLRNNSPTVKDGFFQYTAASDSKHQVILEERKSARVYFEYKEMLAALPDPFLQETGWRAFTIMPHR